MGRAGRERPIVGANLDAYDAPSSCNITVDDDPGNGDHNTIQEAINNANEGEVICVEDGNYNEFSVDKGLTIAGLTNPASGSAKVVPSSASVNYLANITADNVTIEGLYFDGSSEQFTGGQTAGVHIEGNDNRNNVNVVYNVIENLAATDDGAASKGVQWFTEGGTNYILSNSVIANNVISGISSVTNGGYGVQTVGAMDDVDIQHNTISNVSGSWGAGIAFDTKDSSLTLMSGVNVMYNQIVDGVSDPGNGLFAVQVEYVVDDSGISVNQNNVESLFHGGGNTPDGGEGTLDAENNWWGDTNPVDDTYGDIDYSPYESNIFLSY